MERLVFQQQPGGVREVWLWRRWRGRDHDRPDLLQLLDLLWEGVH